MLNQKTELSTRNHNHNKLVNQIRLNQVKPYHTDEKQKGLKPSADLDINKPIYEIQLHSQTIDVSNSVQYIMEIFRKLSSRVNDGVIYKQEHGFKSVFFKH